MFAILRSDSTSDFLSRHGIRRGSPGMPYLPEVGEEILLRKASDYGPDFVIAEADTFILMARKIVDNSEEFFGVLYSCTALDAYAWKLTPGATTTQANEQAVLNVLD